MDGSTIFIILGIAVVFLFVMAARSQSEIDVEKDKKLKESGIDLSQLIPMGKYLSGHPALDDSFKDAMFDITATNVKLYQANILIKEAKFKANINPDSITNISYEDESSIRHKVTVGRLFTIGLFAFAAKKKVKDELAYIIIDWNDGRFDHKTIFEYEGKGSTEVANKSRNKIIRKLSASPTPTVAISDKEIRDVDNSEYDKFK